MLTPPYIAYQIATMTHSSAIEVAKQRRVLRDAKLVRSLDRLRIPNRVPRSWRWRYG